MVPSLSKKPLSVAEKRRKEQKARVGQAAMELLSHFNYRNMDAIIKSTRNTLEAMRRRIFSTLTIQFDKSKPRDAKPCFKAYATLAIPLVLMQPSVEEIQSALTKAVSLVTFVSKGVSQWSKQRKTVASALPLIPQPALAIADKAATNLNKQPTAVDGEGAAPAAVGEQAGAAAGAPSGDQKAPEGASGDGAAAAAPAAAAAAAATPADAQPAGAAADPAAATAGGDGAGAGEAPAGSARERTQKKLQSHQADAEQEVQQIIVQARNYFRNVSDNKEISKLINVLSSIISSSKRVCIFFAWPSYD